MKDDLSKSPSLVPLEERHVAAENEHSANDLHPSQAVRATRAPTVRDSGRAAHLQRRAAPILPARPAGAAAAKCLLKSADELACRHSRRGSAIHAAAEQTRPRARPPGAPRLPPRPTDSRLGCRGTPQSVPTRQPECCTSSAPASPPAAALRALNNASRPPSPASPLFMYTPGADAPREPLFVLHVREAGP